MTASSLTYAELEAAVADRADIVVGSGARHTTAKMQARIGRSIKKWMLLMYEAGDDTYLKVARVTTNPSSTIDANTGMAPRQYVVQPAGLLYVRGIDIYRTGNDAPRSMVTFDEAERNDPALYGEWWNRPNTGMPRLYRLGGYNTSTGDYLIQVSPWADAAYTMDIRYLPAVYPTFTGGTVYDLILGGESYVIADAAMQCLTVDGRAGTPEFIASLAAERDKTEADAIANLSRRSSFQKRDTWLERRAARTFNRWQDW